MYDGSPASFVVAFVSLAAPLLLLTAVLLFLRAIIASGVHEGIRRARKEEDPIVVLKGRYARGEIDEAEYEHRREVLSAPQRSGPQR